MLGEILEMPLGCRHNKITSTDYPGSQVWPRYRWNLRGLPRLREAAAL